MKAFFSTVCKRFFCFFTFQHYMYFKFISKTVRKRKSSAIIYLFRTSPKKAFFGPNSM